ncbi:ParB/RepB/Spo0J family partition protein [Ramlibacter sp. AN1133]|uniref:ParB/RepB/Spo0J family partition protein n=1 Tax=Ramlibacter sp. AN1133 TaxID=3133429 RepID=UPI0030C380D6
MRLPWRKSPLHQLDLLGDVPAIDAEQAATQSQKLPAPRLATGRPATVPIALIDEDPANPRADFSETELDDLAADIELRGILVPLVVHPANADGRYLLHFGARRLRAATRAGLHEVPVVVRDAPADRYAQVAENVRRANLEPLDLARFIRQQMHAGDSQAEVSRRLGMNLTTVAHHLSLLDLPPMLADALKSGRCTSPRTLHELSKLNEQQPEMVRSLIEGKGAVTREAVEALRDTTTVAACSPMPRVIQQAHTACERLQRLLARVKPPADEASQADLAALRTKVESLTGYLPQGSDSQTLSATDS